MASARRYRTEFIIDGDSRSAVKANDDARASTERLTREMQQAERQSERTSQGLLAIGTRAAGMAAAVGLSTTGIAAMTAQTATAVREQTNLARAVGVNVQALQSWSYAGRQVGVDTEKMGDIFKDTADKIGDAFANGGGEAMDALKALNLSAAELVNLSPDQQIIAIGERLKGLPKAQQVTIMESLADDASRLIPLFEDNNRLLTEYAQQARDLRIVLPQEDIDQLDAAGQSMQYLQEAGRGLAQTVAADLAPTINDMAENVDWLIDRLGGMNGIVDKGTVALELMAAVAAGRALVGIGNLRDRVGDYINTQRTQIQTQNTAIETERRASAEALRLAQSRQASAKQMLANAQATAAATGITTNRTRAIAQLAAANTELISAEQRHAASLNAVAASASRTTVVMQGLQRVGSGALAMLGGWPGLLIAGASALVLFSDDAEDTAGSIDVLKQSTDEFTDSLESMTAVTANAALVRLGEQIDDTRDQVKDAAQDVSYLDGMLAGKGPVPVRGRERVRMENDLALARERLQDVTESYNEQLERQDQLQQVANGTWKDAADAANDAAGGIDRVGTALGTSADKWDDYLGKLQAARDTLGMTADEAAEYAASQAGYTGLYAEQSGAIAGQTDALKSYQTALEEGDQAEADVQLARAQRFAESEAMVQAQLANLDTLSGLLKGVQSDLSATALSASLVVGSGAGNVSDLVAQALATIQARAAAIQGSTEFGSKATDETKALNKELKDAESTYDRLRESFDPLGTAADEYAKKQAALNLLLQNGKITAEEAATAQAELSQQYRDSIDPLQGIIGRMDPAGAMLRDFRRDLEDMQEAARAAGRSELEITAATAQLAAEYAKAEREADPYYQRTLELRQEYDNSALKARQLQKDLDDLNQRYRDGVIGQQTYQHGVKAIRDEMRELARESDPAAQEMARAWEEAADRIDETFADAFAGAFDSFDDFSGQLLDGFKRLLAELAYQATLKPIVVGFTSDVQGMLGIGGASASSGSGAGGFTNTIAGAKRAWDTGSTLFGGGSAIGGTAAAGYGAAGWAGSATGAYTGWAGSAAAGAASASTIGSMAAAAMPYVGAALVADQVLLGGAISDALGGAISSIGDALGFGSSRKYKAGFVQTAETPDGPAQDRYYDSGNTGRLVGGRQTAFGSFGYTFKEKFEPQDMADMLDAIEQVDNALAAAMDPSEIDAIKTALDGFQTKVQNDPLSDIFNRRLDVIIGAIDTSFDDLLEGVEPDEKVKRLVAGLKVEQITDGLAGAVVDDVNDAFRDAVNGGVDLDEAVASIQSAVASLQQFGAMARSAGLGFDASASGALEAASNINALAGGLDNLSALQQSYVESYYSEAERQQMTLGSLTHQVTAFNEATGASVQDKGGLRDLIDSLDLMTESGQKTYVAALNIAGAFDQIEQIGTAAVDAVNERFDALASAAQSTVSSAEAAARQALNQFNDQSYQQQLDLLALAGRDQAALNLQRERELETIDESLRPIQERIWALQDEKEAHEAAQKAATDYQDALASAGDQLAGTLGSISQWVDQQTATGGSPGMDLQESQAQFARQLIAAKNGDRDALQSITQYADRYLSAGQDYYGSGTGYQSIRDDVLEALEDLPDQVSAEEYIADEIKQALIEQTAGITGDLSDVLRGDNPSSIAGELAGYFDLLAGGIDGVLTRDQLALIMNGKATDAQIDAMIRALDLNGDDIVTGLESVIVEGMPTDAILANVLQAQLKANGGKALTESQVRKALSPIATDAQIASFMRAADRNADGMIDAQELSNSRLAGLSSGIAKSLDPMFSSLDKNVDGLLTFGELRDGLDGIATDDEIRALSRTFDLNGDDIVSKLESVVIKDMPTDSRLANVLLSQLKSNGGKALTESQVRKALSPIATDAQIESFMRAADRNADGMIDAQEAGNSRLAGLSKGIAGALNPMFDKIDSSLDGLIDYDEFGKYFDGLASDKRLREIFNQLDTDGDGQISALEAVKASTDQVGDNTGSLEERSLEQLQKLTGLTSEMARSTDQFIGLNSTMVSLRESINALGVAQREAARIEKARQEAEAAAKERVELERKLSGYESTLDSLNSKLGSTQSDIKDLSKQRDTYDYVDYRNDHAADQWSNIDKTYKGYTGYIGDENAWWDDGKLKTSGNSDERHNIKNLWDTLSDYVHAFNRATGEGSNKLLELDETDFYGEGDSRNRFQIEYGGKTYYAGYNDQGIQTMDDAWDAMQDALNSYYGTNFDWRDGDSVRDQLGDAQSSLDDLLGDRNSTQKEIDDLKKQIEKLRKIEQYDGSHATGLDYVPFDGYIAETHAGERIMTAAQNRQWGPLIDGGIPPVVMPPPSMGGDNAQLERLLRDNNRLMQQNADLLRQIEQHGAAGVRVSAEGARQQIAATERGNRSLERLQSDKRLEAARA